MAAALNGVKGANVCLDARRGWAMQLHLAALRNLNTPMFRKLGPDTGYDAVSDEPTARKLGLFLDAHLFHQRSEDTADALGGLAQELLFADGGGGGHGGTLQALPATSLTIAGVTARATLGKCVR